MSEYLGERPQAEHAEEDYKNAVEKLVSKSKVRLESEQLQSFLDSEQCEYFIHRQKGDRLVNMAYNPHAASRERTRLVRRELDYVLRLFLSDMTQEQFETIVKESDVLTTEQTYTLIRLLHGEPIKRISLNYQSQLETQIADLKHGLVPNEHTKDQEKYNRYLRDRNALLQDYVLSTLKDVVAKIDNNDLPSEVCDQFDTWAAVPANAKIVEKIRESELK